MCPAIAAAEGTELGERPADHGGAATISKRAASVTSTQRLARIAPRSSSSAGKVPSRAAGTGAASAPTARVREASGREAKVSDRAASARIAGIQGGSEAGRQRAAGQRVGRRASRLADALRFGKSWR